MGEPAGEATDVYTALLPADTTASANARRRLIEWLRPLDASPQERANLLLALSELVANVVQHGDADEVVVGLDLRDPRRWTIEVRGGRRPLPDEFLDPSRWTVTDPADAAGRGLGIVRAVVDEIEVVSAGEGSVIRCHVARHSRSGAAEPPS